MSEERRFVTLDKEWSHSDFTISEDGFSFKKTTVNHNGTRATIGATAGKLYWEVTVIDAPSSGGRLAIGVAKEEQSNEGTNLYTSIPNARTFSGTEKANPRSNYGSGGLFKPNDIIGVALDLDNRSLRFYQNGVDMGIAYSGENTTSGIDSNTTWYPYFTTWNSAEVKVNFGQEEFIYDLPEGFEPYSKYYNKNIYIKSNDKYLEFVDENIIEHTEPYVHNLPINLTQGNKQKIFDNYNGFFVLQYCTDGPKVFSVNTQTTHELNLLQDDLLQADKIQILNWFEEEEDVNLKVFGELNNKFTSINKVINHEQVLKIVADSIGNAKFLVSEDKNIWKRWNTVEWETVTFSHKDEIATLGMSKNALKDITKAQWEQLGHEFYLGVYLDKQTEIKNINYQSGIPNLTPEVSNASLYILNTTATLDITLQGNKLYGVVTDDDKGKVQYRIILNGDPYLPDDGTFTPLEPEPQNINLRIPSDKLNIGGNNTIRIEFQDAWGSLDYWQTSFIGELNGLLFFDEQGELYSDELGEVIKPLDFGTIITGQMSLEHKIIFKNTLGQPVKDVKFFSDWGEYSPVAGVGYRFSLSDSPFAGYEVLELERPVDHEEEVEIFVKMSTILGTTPETLGKVKFCVKATEIDDDEYQEILNNLS